MPELGTPFSTPAAARETPLPSKEPAASVAHKSTPYAAPVAHKSTPAAACKTPLASEEASACAQATASALAGLTVGLSPSTPSPPKASPRASPAGVLPPQESNSDPDCCLLDAAAAPPLPPVAYPYLSSLNDVISKSYVVAGAAVGLALGVAYSLGLARQRPPM
jgi:hypothetical protein